MLALYMGVFRRVASRLKYWMSGILTDVLVQDRLNWPYSPAYSNATVADLLKRAPDGAMARRSRPVRSRCDRSPLRRPPPRGVLNTELGVLLFPVLLGRGGT